MRHLRKGRKFKRKRGQRKSFIRGLEFNLIMKGSIKTTDARAKELKSRVEKLVTIGKKQDLAGLRRLLALLPKKAAMKLYYDIAPRYQDRKGGYVRVLKLSQSRLKDAASMSLVEWV